MTKKIKLCKVCNVAHERRGITCSTECMTLFKRMNSKAFIKSCKLCGDTFGATKEHTLYCDKEHKANCLNCNKEFKIKNNSKPGVSCSSSCASAIGHTKDSQLKRKINSQAKWGTDSPLQAEEVKAKIEEGIKGTAGRFGTEASKKAMIAKFGVDNIQKFEEFQAKIKEDLIAKYGVDNIAKLPETQEKIKKTNIERYGVDSFAKTDKFKKDLKEYSLAKYGVDHPMKAKVVKEKVKATNQAKHGVDYPLQSEIFKEKAKATSLERYGVEHHMKLDSFKEKVRETNQAKYGVENVFSSEEIKDKIKNTLIERYGVEYPSQMSNHAQKVRESSLINYGYSSFVKSDNVQNKMKSTMLKRYGFEHALQVDDFRIKAADTFFENLNAGLIDGISRVSKLNRRFAKMISEDYNVKVLFEKRLESSSFDLFIESKKLLIDLNPTVSHNVTKPFMCIVQACEDNCQIHLRKFENNYHFNRAKLAQVNGYKLIQIYDWMTDKQIKMLLDSKLKLNYEKFSARKLFFKKIANSEANIFFNAYHIQGAARGALYSYGLFNGHELLAVANFSRTRFGAKYEYEFLRYAVKKDIIIHGGAGILVKAFINEVKPKNIISYVDFNHSTGESFLKSIGFEETSPTGASAIWFNSKTKKKIYENSVLKIGADKLLGTNYGSLESSGMNNSDILIKEGFLKIYTAGNRVFVWNE